MKYRVLITDHEMINIDCERRVLEKIDAQLIDSQCKTEQDVIENAQGVDGLLVDYAPIGESVFKALPRLKVVARYGVGYDKVDVRAANQYGVCVVNVQNYCTEEVSDHALALLMASIRKIVLFDNWVKKRNWNYNFSKPIYRIKNKNMGIIGFGNISRRLVEKLQPFKMNILVYDPFVHPDLAKDFGVTLTSLDQLVTESDYISIHAPLNKDTRHLIGTKELNLMKDSVFIVNTSRGGLIDEKALIDALRNKKIAGAALDVFDQEPINQDNPLLSMENVILSPHVGWYSEESQIDLQTKAAQGVADVLIGKKPQYLVNPEVWKE